MTMTHRENIPFFNELPPKAIKAASRLWDASHDPAYNGVQAYNDFAQDLTFAGITAPPRSVVKRWLAGIQAGLIERPGGPVELGAESLLSDVPETSGKARQAARKARRPAAEVAAIPADEDISQADPFEDSPVDDPFALSPADLDFAPEQGGAFEKLTPATFGRTAFAPLLEAGITPPKPDDERPDPALALIARQMIEEEVARINLNVRAQAMASVAARLRQVAATLDAATTV